MSIEKAGIDLTSLKTEKGMKQALRLHRLVVVSFWGVGVIVFSTIPVFWVFAATSDGPAWPLGCFAMLVVNFAYWFVGAVLMIAHVYGSDWAVGVVEKRESNSIHLESVRQQELDELMSLDR